MNIIEERAYKLQNHGEYTAGAVNSKKKKTNATIIVNLGLK